MQRSFPASVAALALAASLGLAACSSTSDSPGTTTAPSASGPTTAYRWGVAGNDGKIPATRRRTPTVVSGIPGQVVQIATSNSDSYALTSSGEVFAWGADGYAELGNGTQEVYTNQAVRVDFPPGVRIARLPNPMPFDAGMAIDSTGHVWGWGLDAGHDLCLSRLLLKRPRRIPLSDVTLATGARTHTLYVSHGRLLGCGSNSAGELGNGMMTGAETRPTPVLGLPGGEPVAALTSSWEGSGVLLSNGAYYDWGYNRAGQLGDGTRANSAVPVRVHLPGPVVDVFQGGSYPDNGQTVAVLSDGHVFAWGNNRHGQLGDGRLVNSHVPVRVQVPKGVHFVQVASGGDTSYAIDSAGRLWAWGLNGDGELGMAPGAYISTLPVEVGVRLTEVSSTARNVAGFWRQG